MPSIPPLVSLPIDLLLQNPGKEERSPPSVPGGEAAKAPAQGGVLLSGNLPALLQQGAQQGTGTLPGTLLPAQPGTEGRLPQTADRPAGREMAQIPPATSSDPAGRNTGIVGLAPGHAPGLVASDAALHTGSIEPRRRTTTVVAAADIPARLPANSALSPAGSVIGTSLKLLLASSALLVFLRLLQ